MGVQTQVAGCVVQAEYKGSRDGQAIENILHWSALDAHDGDPTVTFDTDIMDQSLIQRFENTVIPMMLPGYRLDEVVFRHITALKFGPTKKEYSFLETRVSKYAVGTAGTKPSASDPTATLMSVGIQKVTADASKFARGSLRADGLREEDVNGNLIDETQAIAYEAAWQDYGAPLQIPNSIPGTDNWKCVVFSRTKGFAPNTDEDHPGRDNCEEIVEWRANRFVSSQVSRKRRKGGA